MAKAGICGDEPLESGFLVVGSGCGCEEVDDGGDLAGGVLHGGGGKRQGPQNKVM